MALYVNYRMRVTMADARVIIGTFLAYDKYLNIILADSEEFRKACGLLFCVFLDVYFVCCCLNICQRMTLDQGKEGWSGGARRATRTRVHSTTWGERSLHYH